jgi:hypothetical protein
VTGNAQVGTEGVGVAVGTDAYAKSGTEVEAHATAGQNGIDVGASASVGNAVGVDATGTESLREASITGGAGVSAGEHFEAGGGATATFEDGKATVGVSGDVAALIGVEADVGVTVDTKQIQADTNAVVESATEAEKVVANTLVDTGAKVVVEDTGKKAGNSIVDTAKRAGNTVRKWFKF